MASKDLEFELNAYKQVAAENNAFNAKEALKNRDFQERMSSTSHQREVKDLIKAGLNPVLSANAGASTPAGSMATADTSTNSAMATSFSSKRQAETALKTAQIQANATMAAAAAAAGAQMYSANKAYEASKFQSNNSLKASLFGSAMSAFASMQNAQTSRGSTLWGFLSNLGNSIDTTYSYATGIPVQADLNSQNAAHSLMQNMDAYFGADFNLLNVGNSNSQARRSLNSRGRYYW